MSHPIPIYYDGSILVEEDYANLAADHKIPYTDLASCVEQVRTKGEPLYSLYPSTTRERVRTFFGRLSFEPDEAVVVDGLKQPILAPSPPSVALSQGDPVATPSSVPPLTKKRTSAVMLVEDFPNDEGEWPEALESTEPAEPSEHDEVAESAAVMIMQAMVGDSASFLITEEGICSINPAHPPSLVHSYQVVTSVLKLPELSDKISDKGCWMLGSILAALEDFHGENFNVGQVCEQTEKAENTIRTALSVFKAFRDKRYDLSFSSHKEGWHMKAPLEVKKLILHKAETYELTTKQIRALGSVYRAMDDDTTIRNIRSKQQAIDLCDAVNRVKVKWLAYEDGVMFELTRTDGSVPSGQMAIDLKNKEFYINGEKAGDITKPGVK